MEEERKPLNPERQPILPILEGDLENEYFNIIESGYSIKDIIRKSWKC